MQRAIVIQGPGPAAVTSIPIPDVYQDFLKIRTQAVALNPSDWKHIDWRADKGAIVGIDYAGYVEEVGPLVSRKVILPETSVRQQSVAWCCLVVAAAACSSLMV